VHSTITTHKIHDQILPTFSEKNTANLISEKYRNDINNILAVAVAIGSGVTWAVVVKLLLPSTCYLMPVESQTARTPVRERNSVCKKCIGRNNELSINRNCREKNVNAAINPNL
jgi:hypothetical protein